jgi:hypothetical protein
MLNRVCFKINWNIDRLQQDHAEMAVVIRNLSKDTDILTSTLSTKCILVSSCAYSVKPNLNGEDYEYVMCLSSW